MSANRSRLPPVEVGVTQRFDAPPEHVFDAWLDPAIAGRWLFATASRPMSQVKIDARPGGSFRFADGVNGDDVTRSGQYVEIAPPRRLVFTLSMENRPKFVTRVIAEIVPLKSGCELRLAHENVPRDHARHIEGRWAGMLYGLATILGHHSRRTRPASGRH